MAQELAGNCLGSAASQSDYIGYWVNGGFIDAIVCPFADSFTGIGFALLLLVGLLVYLAITNESFVILAILGIIVSGFILQVVTYGPLLEAWFLIVIFSVVAAIYGLYRKLSN
tara:strand:- start:235 stop:573 length:339 start_codon:yes stop_codon:yes gene_type:complete